MSAPHEDIARRVATRLAPEFGEALPMYVERAIALGDAAAEEPPQQFGDPHTLLQAAGLIVAATKAAWDIAWKLAEERKKRSAALPPAAESAPKPTAAQAPPSERDVIAAHVRRAAYLPDDFTQQQREQIVDGAVEEMLAVLTEQDAKR